MNFDFKEGEVMLVNKPLDWTSFHVVKKVKYLFKIKKIGHAGTLDPLATGLLVLCTGKKTKIIESIQARKKEYTGIITLGKTTPSYDLETEFDQEFDTSDITEEQIYQVAQQLSGEIEQKPPIFSAVKVDGKRAYHLARQGKVEEKAMKTRIVQIDAFEITQIDGDHVHFRIECSKGTYIRSIASDFGKLLNSGAHLSQLCRTKIGEYQIEDAHSIDDLIAIRDTLAASNPNTSVN